MERVKVEIRVFGTVQGVGFRPFVHRLAGRYALCGRVRNTSDGALIEAEGLRGAVDGFLRSLREEKPHLAHIERIETSFGKAEGLTGFEIAESRTFSRRNTLIPPDTAVCPDCLREMRDPSDRRYRYPFINCTNCGPRFTIIGDVPYDRKFTTMAGFPLCPACALEYTDIEDRRYHAEPVCCPDCGPRLIYSGPDGREIAGDPVRLAADLLKHRGILAVKGLGGIHLSCVTDDGGGAAAELRRRKRRDEKPFAVMCRDTETARRFCVVSAEEQALLESPARPIVLLKKKDRGSLREVSENGYLGIMLGYTPVHELLFQEGLDMFVMTSANLADLPVLYRDEEALSSLAGIADGFLLNDRAIRNRCDDSLFSVALGRPYPIRRSRGYVPAPLDLAWAKSGVLACGAEQKASFSLSRDASVFQSPHIGDLKNMETLEHYTEQIGFFEHLFSISPGLLACDLHPDYLSTDYAERRAERERLPLLRIQHHWAHMASCMADNGLEGEVIGVVWDGTGYGTDGTVWGGEFLTGGFGGFVRAGSLMPFSLPGGDASVRKIRRIGRSLLGLDGSGTDSVCTSVGRLFDGMCAILGLRDEASYEGQGAAALQTAADEDCRDVFPYRIVREDGILRFDWTEMVRAAASAVRDDPHSAGRMAAMFMNTLAAMAADLCGRIRSDTGLDRVVLSGGCFQNLYLLERTDAALRTNGFQVFRHGRVSCNDEGISFGQLAIASFPGNAEKPEELFGS